jgi:hypothetical protein
MRRPPPVRRVAAAVLLVVWLPAVVSPAPGFAQEEEAAPAAEEAAPAAEEVAPPPAEERWWDPVVRNTNTGIDLLLVRPFAALTLGVGAVLFVPAAIMTSPNGRDSINDAYQRFIGEPADYLVSRPLGQF